MKRIPWDNEEEIARLKELVAEGKDWGEIANVLQKEFRHTRPKNENGKPKKRSSESVFWFHQRLSRKEREEKGEPIQRRTRRSTRNDNPSMDPPEEGFRIVVISSSGNTVMMITTNKDIDEINKSMKSLF